MFQGRMKSVGWFQLGVVFGIFFGGLDWLVGFGG